MKLSTDFSLDERSPNSRKSHSGGLLQVGHHLVQQWYRRQPMIALSSGQPRNVLRDMRGKVW